MEKSIFMTLNEINVNEHAEKKNGLTYLSWAWAWGELKKKFPDATYTIYENECGWNYHTDGKTCWVKTGVSINGLEHIEYLPVMDYKNRSIGADNVTSFDVNKAIQRSLTKAVARHGLGLYIYAGEDLPESEAEAADRNTKPVASATSAPVQPIDQCEVCGKKIEPYISTKDGHLVEPLEHAAISRRLMKGVWCPECITRQRDADRRARGEIRNEITS